MIQDRLMDYFYFYRVYKEYLGVYVCLDNVICICIYYGKGKSLEYRLQNSIKQYVSKFILI
jgi:hypothetical protein